MIDAGTHLQIGSLLFEGIDQIDLTGPFEVLSRVPNSTYRLYAPTMDAVRDVKGLRILPDATLAEAPPLDVLHVPGGRGQEAFMGDAALLGWLGGAGGGGAERVLGVHRGVAAGGGGAAGGAAGDDALGVVPSAAVFRGGAGG